MTGDELIGELLDSIAGVIEQYDLEVIGYDTRCLEFSHRSGLVWTLRIEREVSSRNSSASGAPAPIHKT